MVKKIVIGSDLNPLSNSIALWAWADISKNKLFYILRSDYAEVFIHKDSDEAAALEEWLTVDTNRNNESIHKKVLEYLLPRMTVDEFMEIIDNEKNVSRKEGYKQAQHDMLAVLGIYHH